MAESGKNFWLPRNKKRLFRFHLKLQKQSFIMSKKPYRNPLRSRGAAGTSSPGYRKQGGFLEPERKVVTDEEFIGSCLKLNYVIHADQLKSGNQIGEIIVRSPYQELRYQVTASKSPQIRIDIRREEKKHKAELIHDYIEYRIGHTDCETWISHTERILDRLKVSGCEYPEYHFYQAYIAHIKGDDQTAASLLKQYQLKGVYKRGTGAGRHLYCIFAQYAVISG